MSKDSHGNVKVNVIDNEYTASASASATSMSSGKKKTKKKKIKPDLVVLNAPANEETTRFSVHHENQENQNA
jgi:hypothetical protein